MSSSVRLLLVVLVGCLVLAAVVGSFWLVQADVLMTAQVPGPRWSLPTPTLYPTEPPAAAVIAKPTPAPVGNRRTPVPAVAVTVLSPTVTPQGVCEIPPGWVAYVVRDDDTWENLAQRSQTNAQELLRGNCLSTALGLKEVPLLYLPAIASVTLVPTEVVVQCKTPPAGWLTITVARGETLWGLSQRYGTTPELLMVYNCLPTTGIQAGSRFHVPPTLVQPTPLPTLIWLPTLTATPTLVPTDTPLPTPTATPTLIPTDTPLLTPTTTPTLTPTPTETPVLIPTWTPAPWPWPTSLPAATPTPTSTPPQPTPTGTTDTSLTATPLRTSTPSPTATATTAPLPSPTPTVMPTTEPSPVPLPTATVEPSPTSAPVP